MQNLKSPFVVANVILGARHEPFFSSCLSSVEKGIDFLVLNDNSGDPQNPNLRSFHASKLFKEGRTALIQTKLSDLSGFDEARNLCLAETAKRFPNENLWILYLDTDEVHTEGLAQLTREFLHRLPDDVTVVDGYFYQFIQSFQYYASLDRRHNLLFRYHPNLRWEKPIHSQLLGIRGRRVPTGYTYFHYGYLYAPENVLERWRLYKKYDSIPYDPEQLPPDHLFRNFEEGMILVPFHGKHPEALSLYFRENSDMEHLTRFTAAITRRFKQSRIWQGLAKLREINWELRLAFRRLQARLACARKR